MSYGKTEDIVRRLDGMTALMKRCAAKGRPELLAKLDRRALVTGCVVTGDEAQAASPLQPPAGEHWIVGRIESHPESYFADLVVGNTPRGPIEIPHRFDLVPARQLLMVTTKPGLLLPEDAEVRLFGWRLGDDELFECEQVLWGAEEP